MLRAADAFRITWSEPFVSDTRIHHLNALTEKAWEDAVQGLGNRESKLHVYGKRQTADSSRKFLKIENEQIKTAQTILTILILGVEIMNSKRQSKRKLGHVVQILVRRLTLVNMMLNISDVHTSLDSFRDENHT